ncbi:hypothetical protein NL64_09240 [Pseudomonas fluorescens]|nr:hypothetical protein NL64_09240 [Pseudomonas fluorescens]
MNTCAAQQTRIGSRQEALQSQCQLLPRVIADLATGLGKYLRLTSTAWSRNDGSVGESYARLGVKPASIFKEKPWYQLSIESGAVSCAIAITIASRDKSLWTSYVFDLDVQFCEAGYRFEVNNDHHLILSVAEVDARVFEPIYKQIVEILKARLYKSTI